MEINAHATVPKGEYYLGDPCHVIPEILWDSTLGATRTFEIPFFDGHKNADGEMLPIVALSTGVDGQFFDQFANSYGVDAGFIGLVPAESVDMLVRADVTRKELGQFIELEEPCDVIDYNGILVFGPYIIDARSAYRYFTPQEDPS